MRGRLVCDNSFPPSIPPFCLLFKKTRIPRWIIISTIAIIPKEESNGPYILGDLMVMIVFLTCFSLASVCPKWWVFFVSGANSIYIQASNDSYLSVSPGIRHLKLPIGPIMVGMEIGAKRLIVHIVCYLTHTFERPPTQYGQSMYSKQHVSQYCEFLQLKCGIHFKKPIVVIIVL